jgi:hypothetical protein
LRPPRLLAVLSYGPDGTAALASGAIAAVRLRAVKAARIIFFIGILHLLSGGMSGFDGRYMDLLWPVDNAASQHWTYALNAGDITKPCAVWDLWT